MKWLVVVWVVVAGALAPAVADAWNRCTAAPGGAGSSLEIDRVDRPQSGRESVSTACHDTAEDTATDSGILATWPCAYIDLDGSAMAGGTAYVYRCTAPSTSYCTKMLVDTDGDGVPDDVTLDGVTIGRVGQQYQTALWLWIDWQTAPTGFGRIAVLCH